MKTAQLPPVRFEPSVRKEIDSVRRDGESLSELALERGDFDLPVRAIDAIRHEMRILETNPYTCGEAGSNPLERELVIPFGGSG